MNGLHAAFDEYVADVSGYGDLDRAIDQAALERRRSGLVAVVAATVAVLLVIAGVLATSRDGRVALQPLGPSPKATTSASAKATEWPGAIRSGTSWPVVSDKRLGPPGNAWRGRIDGRDSAVGEIDIRILSGLRLSRSGCASPCWILGLQADPPRETPRAAAPVIEYGVIVDTDGDRVGDCELGLTTDAPGGEYRAWLTNLRSGATDEQIGPPYGYPFDFSILSKAGEERQSAVFFYFLNGVWRKPCERPDGPIEWYAYASLTEEGRVTAWDFAPDAAWFRARGEAVDASRASAGDRGLGVAGWFRASSPDVDEQLREGSALVVASSRGLQTR